MLVRRNTAVITGFGPFKDILINPSWLAVSALPASISSFSIVKKEMAVDYQQVTAIVPELINEYKPQLVIHVGVGHAGALKLETMANNTGYNQPDINGHLPSKQSVVQYPAQEPMCTSIPVDEIVHQACALGLAVQPSNNAGRFLCEFIYATTMYYSEKCMHGIPCLFIHVPPLDAPYSHHELNHALLQVVELVIAQLEMQIQI